MEREFWEKKWEEKVINFHQEIVNENLKDYFPQLNVEKGATVFVPLCGKSLDMLWFAQQDFEVIGVELSEIAVKEFFHENNLEYQVSKDGTLNCYTSGPIKIYQGDFFDLRAEQLKSTKAVYDRAALVALPPEMRARYAKHMLTIIPDCKKYFIEIFSYDQTKVDGPPFSVDVEEVTRLLGAAGKIKIARQAKLQPISPKFEGKVEFISRFLVLIH